MSYNHIPILNAWYINLIGKTMKIKALVYTGDNISQLVLQYADGSTHIIGRESWDCLDLEVLAGHYDMLMSHRPDQTH